MKLLYILIPTLLAAPASLLSAQPTVELVDGYRDATPSRTVDFALVSHFAPAAALTEDFAISREPLEDGDLIRRKDSVQITGDGFRTAHIDSVDGIRMTQEFRLRSHHRLLVEKSLKSDDDFMAKWYVIASGNNTSFRPNLRSWYQTNYGVRLDVVKLPTTVTIVEAPNGFPEAWKPRAVEPPNGTMHRRSTTISDTTDGMLYDGISPITVWSNLENQLGMPVIGPDGPEDTVYTVLLPRVRLTDQLTKLGFVLSEAEQEVEYVVVVPERLFAE